MILADFKGTKETLAPTRVQDNAHEKYKEARSLPAGCEVTFQYFENEAGELEKISNNKRTWCKIPMGRIGRNLEAKSNQGHVVRRIKNLMLKYKKSMFNGVTKHAELPDFDNDTGHGIGEVINP